MKFVTLATADSERLECLLASARRAGVDFVRLGAGRAFSSHGVKIVFLTEFLRTRPADEIVLFADAADVLWLRPAAGLEAAFASFDCDIVFSVEQYFYFLAPEKFSHWRRYPPGRPPLPHRRFLNAGAFIGRAGALLRLFAATGIDASTPCDQTVFAQHLLRHPGEFTLDYRQQIFAGTGGREGFEADDYAVANGVLRDRRTGTKPFLIHFPGKNFTGYDWVRRQLPFAGPTPAVTAADHRRQCANRRRNRLGARLGLDNYGRHLVETGAKAGALALAAAIAAWFFFR